MAWPKLDVNVESIAISLSTQVTSANDLISAWRGNIANTSSGDGMQSQACYQALISLRNFGNSVVQNNASALASAYVRRDPALAGFDPVKEWTQLKSAIDAFSSWFQTNWPKSAAGYPVFMQYNTSGDLQSLSIPLGGGMKTAVLAQIDAILNALS